MMKETVCILIPTKDRSALLSRALSSVLRQSVMPDEVIIVNDGSTDSTREFLDGFAKQNSNLNITIIHRDRNGGVNTARNQGIRLSVSDWIMFLDDDDELLPDAVLLAKNKGEQIPDDFFMFYFNTLIRNDQTEFIGGFQFDEKQEYFDPSYDEVMVKFGLKGDCKPVFRRQLFSNPDYYFPESVNGFESMTIRLIARDGKKMRYYSDLSTMVNLQRSFEHLSFSAAAKNPKAYMDLHARDLYDHLCFYLAHPDLFSKKYKDMAKLAYRAHEYFLACTYVVGSLYSRTGICIPVGINDIKCGMLDMIVKCTMRWFGMARWIRLGLRYRILLSRGYEDYPFSVSFFGYTYVGNLNDYIDRYVFYFGSYEREELAMLKKYLSETSVVFDIGANVGHHSLFFSRYSSVVYAFEPYKKMFNILNKRIDSNNIKNIYPFNIGLGDIDMFSDFYASVNNNEGIGSFVPGANKNKIGQLEIKNGDGFVVAHKIHKIDMIKIDVEGMEASVIRGLLSTIQRDWPVMFIETDELFRNLMVTEFKKIFSRYNTYIVNPNQPFMYIFNKPGCILELSYPISNVKNIICIPNKNI